MGLNVWADDWKYVGKNHYNCLQTMTFYEAESVEYTLNGNCKAWIKGISVGELNRVMKKNDREIVRKSAEKVLTSYIPPYSLVDVKKSFIEVVDIITWEGTASHPDTKPVLLIRIELDCKNKAMRTLSSAYYKGDNTIETDLEAGDWQLINPETNGKKILDILCTCE